MSVTQFFKGTFLTEPNIILQKLERIKAYVFDWDGVFNDGTKNESGSSPFNEVDAMGTNLLRFSHYLLHGTVPFTMVISGENNKAARTLATREHFNAVYSGIKFKTEALQHLCTQCNIKEDEVAFVFDDVLDLSVAAVSGISIMIGRTCNPMLIDFTTRHKYANYITAAEGGKGGLREATELLIALGGRYDDVVKERMQFTNTYQGYLAQRNKAETQFYTSRNAQIIQDTLS